MQSPLKSALILSILVLAAPVASAEVGLALKPESKLWLTGSSNVHDYKSTASQLKVTFQIDPAKLNATLPPGEAVEKIIRDQGVTSIQAIVAVAGMKSGKSGLDKNMSKALLADKHPEIKFEMTSYEVAAASTPEALTIQAKGKLTVAGVDRETPITLNGKREGDTVRLEGSVPLLMTQFKIKPPTMMMGAMRTSDQVTVHLDLKVGVADSEGSQGAARGTP
jgi:polyisoprenoid-binding protein YceI